MHRGRCRGGEEEAVRNRRDQRCIWIGTKRKRERSQTSTPLSISIFRFKRFKTICNFNFVQLFKIFSVYDKKAEKIYFSFLRKTHKI